MRSTIVATLWSILFSVATLAISANAEAEEIVVSNYAINAGGIPYTVALEKGFFKEEGADVTGIISSEGGGTTLRNMLQGNVAYGEVNPLVVVAAVRQGADLKIISDNILTVAEFVWVTKPGSPIKSIKDFKGKRIGYTNPKSTSQALAVLLLEAAGLKPDDAELVKTGGFGEGIVALDLGAVDIIPITEPLWSKYKGKYQVVATAANDLPSLDNSMGIATGQAAATKGEFLKAVLRARRKAVAYIYAHPDEAGDIVAKAYNLEPEVARSAVRNLVNSTAKSGVPYWGPGDIRMAGLERMMRAQRLVGALQGDIDWSKMIDTSFLPDDLKPKK